MENKYRHPWLPYPYVGILIALSIWLLFINGGFWVIIFLWGYRVFYFIISPITWAKKRERRLVEAETAIKEGKAYTFSNKDEVIEDYGIEKGAKLLELAAINNDNAYEAREKVLRDFKERYINDMYIADCRTWNDTWHKLISMPWVNVKSHSEIEKLLKCPDPSTLRPQEWNSILTGIKRERLNKKEEAILQDNKYLNEKRGGLDISKLPPELLQDYKILSYKLIPWGLSYEEKEAKMTAFKEFNKLFNEDIGILGLKEEDLKYVKE